MLPDPPPTHFPFRAEILGHPHGRAGMTVWFHLKLTSVSKRKFRFPFCPDIVEGIDDGDGAYRFGSRLNCHGLGAIAPGQSIVFEMPVWIHPDFPPGRHRLWWGLRNDSGSLLADVYTRDTPLVADP